jgi:hypothetical protein
VRTSSKSLLSSARSMPSCPKTNSTFSARNASSDFDSWGMRGMARAASCPGLRPSDAKAVKTLQRISAYRSMEFYRLIGASLHRDVHHLSPKEMCIISMTPAQLKCRTLHSLHLSSHRIAETKDPGYTLYSSEGVPLVNIAPTLW